MFCKKNAAWNTFQLIRLGAAFKKWLKACTYVKQISLVYHWLIPADFGKIFTGKQKVFENNTHSNRVLLSVLKRGGAIIDMSA